MLFLTDVDNLAKLLERYGIAIKLFTDDLQVYLEVVSSYDATKLQRALDLMSDLAEEWQLTERSVSISKCTLLTVGKPQVQGKYNIS